MTYEEFVYHIYNDHFIRHLDNGTTLYSDQPYAQWEDGDIYSLPVNMTWSYNDGQYPKQYVIDKSLVKSYLHGHEGNSHIVMPVLDRHHKHIGEYVLDVKTRKVIFTLKGQ
jgi:hypothetical protein